jgi:hypothetical protein
LNNYIPAEQYNHLTLLVYGGHLIPPVPIAVISISFACYENNAGNVIGTESCVPFFVIFIDIMVTTVKYIIK